MIVWQIIYHSGNGIEAGEIKRAKSVVVEQLLRGDEFTIKRLRQPWLVGKNKRRRQNAITHLACSHQRHVRSPVVRQCSRKGKRLIFLLPFQDSLHSEIGVIGAGGGITKGVGVLAYRFTWNNALSRTKKLRTINRLRGLVRLPHRSTAAERRRHQTQYDCEVAAGHWQTTTKPHLWITLSPSSSELQEKGRPLSSLDLILRCVWFDDLKRHASRMLAKPTRTVI